MRAIDLSKVLCAIEVPGTGSLAPVMLMVDGSYAYDPALNRSARAAAECWVKNHGDAFRDLLGRLDQ